MAWAAGGKNAELRTVRPELPSAGSGQRTCWGLALTGALLAAGCADGSVPSSFGGPRLPEPSLDAGDRDGGMPGEGLIDDVAGPSSTTDPTLGGRCADDAQCDDGVDCTVDACDTDLLRCRFVPDALFCQDDSYCNGVEVCTQARGCAPGEVVDCNDKTACTIDRCLEAERACAHEARDADADGDVDAHCDGYAGELPAGDCDDQNSSISGLAVEVCGNAKDDDCDLLTDEFDCAAPEFDECGDALVIEGSGTFALSTLAARADVGGSCAPENATDVFAEVVVENGPTDVTLTLIGGSPALALGAFASCGDASSETACHAAVLDEQGRGTARLLLRSLPNGRHTVAVYGAAALDLELAAQFQPATDDPGFETCGQSRGMVPGEVTVVDLFGARADVASECASEQGDRVLHFEVEETSDARVYASFEGGLGRPMLSLRGADCVEDEALCVATDPADLFARGLEPGEHQLVVSSSLPGRVSVLLELVPLTDAPAGDDCSEPPELVPGDVANIDLREFADDVSLGCLPGARDAVLRLSIDEPSDVLLMLRSAEGDTAAVGIAPAGQCHSTGALGCASSEDSPGRLLERRLLPGDYDVVLESALGSKLELVAFTHPSSAPILATTAEDCDTAIDIPPGGGSLQGNSSGAIAHFSAGCDVGGVGEFGAAEQLLRLVLDERRRVVFDTGASAYRTLISVREGPECPGKEIACSGSFDGPPSYLDLLLDPGEYFVQVDGYAGDEGQWFLEVFEAEP